MGSITKNYPAIYHDFQYILIPFVIFPINYKTASCNSDNYIAGKRIEERLPN